MNLNEGEKVKLLIKTLMRNKWDGKINEIKIKFLNKIKMRFKEKLIN